MRGAVLWMGFLFEFPKFCMRTPARFGAPLHQIFDPAPPSSASLIGREWLGHVETAAPAAIISNNVLD
jgi:hypothetical protein